MIRRPARKSFQTIRELLHRLLVLGGAVGLTLLFFMVLPLMQTISKPPSTDLMIQSMDTTQLDAPEPPPEPEPEDEEPEPDDQPPELAEEAPPLDLSQLELALNPGFSDGWLQGDFAVKLDTVVSTEKDVDALFSLADLDQQPRPVYQPGPQLTREVRKHTPGTVYIIFIVDRDGRVESPKVQKSSNPALEKAALDAVEKWKFEPGKRNGQAVRFRMRVPITFPKAE